MAKEVLCPICGATYNLADEQIGRKVRCKKCEHAFTAGGEAKRRVDEDDDEDDRPRSRSRSKARKTRERDEADVKPKKTKPIEEQAKPRTPKEPGIPVSSFIILGVVLGVLFLCCGGGTLVWWAFSQRTTKQNPPRRGELPGKSVLFAVADRHPPDARPVEGLWGGIPSSHQRRPYPKPIPTPTGGGSTTTTGAGST